MAGSQDRPIDPSFWGFGGHVQHLPQNRRSQKLSCGPQTMCAGFPHVVVSRLLLKCYSDWAGSAPPKSQVSYSLHKVCMKFVHSLHQICTKSAQSVHSQGKSLHKVCICIPHAHHKVCTKCANCRLCRLGAHSSHHVFGVFGWSVGQHMAHELM